MAILSAPGGIFVISSMGERFAAVCISADRRESSLRRITADEVLEMSCGN